MTENENTNDHLLNPKIDLYAEGGVRRFLEWLYDPEVDEALEKFIKEGEGE